MLFAAIYTLRDASEEGEKRSLQLFASWRPPFEMKAHYAFADGNGGIAIFEAQSEAQVLEGTGIWWPWFDFRVTPVLPIEEAVPIFQQINDWRDSIG
jgi:Protein of unknown function (DUF3303)